MKKLSFLILSLGLVIMVRSQTLNGFMWQLQNPLIESSSEIVSFSGDKICYSIVNLETYQASIVNGNYKLTASKLTLNLGNNQSFVFKIIWKSANKVILTDEYTNLIYAKVGTKENNFMLNYLLSRSREYNEPFDICPVRSFIGSSYGNDACYICLGSGKCKACRGSGIYSYIYSETCPVCNGSGKCLQCYGSGRR